MRIDAANYFALMQPAASKTEAGADIAAAAFTSAPSETSEVKTLDFASMSNTELQEWVNDQITSGKMTVEESSPFVALTLNVRADGQAADPARDDVPVDFFDRVQKGIEGARWQHNDKAVAFLQSAMDIMTKHQGEPIGIDALA